MNLLPTSIRWRLPISYAAIALLAALALGAVLLTTLRNYYALQEQGYLRDNATAIGFAMLDINAADAPAEWLTGYLRNFAILAQVRVRLLDEDGQVIGDSGSPGNQTFVSIEYAADSVPAYPATSSEVRLFPPRIAFFRSSAELDAVHEADENVVIGVPDQRRFSLPATSTLYGFNLFQDKTDVAGSRSEQVVRTAISRPGGMVNGYVELSEGPAYGQEIVSGVASAWLLASAFAVIVAGGVGLLISQQISRPLIVLTDVTARMSSGDLAARAAISGNDEAGRLARSFNHMANQVEETIVTLRRFVADAAHELHTPLTALRTNLELITLEERPEKRQSFVERAQDQVMRLETLTTDLLELARIEAGVPQAGKRMVNLSVLISETSELYASQADQKNIDFRLDLPDTELIMAGDDAKIRRALSGLLENAIKFTPAGGTIDLGLRSLDSCVEIWVQDTGIGIPADDLPQLFSRFHRGRNAVAYPGSGLGLAIVKAIADYHNGQVTAENCSPGARLSLRLPV